MKAGIIGAKYPDNVIDYYHKIKRALEESNVTVDFRYFETHIEKDRTDLQTAHERNRSILKNCDFFVADTTHYSSGIGYLIAEALHLKKPVLALFNSSVGKQTSGIIKASAKTSKILSFEEYTLENLDYVITHFIQKIQKQLDSKFLLIISPEIEHYLEWASAEYKLHKSQIMRMLVEERMAQDVRWKNYQKL